MAASSHITVVLLDLPASGQSTTTRNQAKSALGIVAALSANPRLIIGTYAEEVSFSGPIASEEAQIRRITEDAFSKVDDATAGDSDLFNALSRSIELLVSESAPSGSSIYLISGSISAPVTSQQQAQMEGLLTRFRDRGWPIKSISLPGPDASASLLSDYARTTGGESLDASFPNGLEATANSILQKAGDGALIPLSEVDLGQSGLISSTVSVAPRTQRTSFIFLKSDPSITASVANPSGVDLSAAGSQETIAINTPLISIWRIQNPMPGEWQTRVKGTGGTVSTLYNSAIRLQLVLESKGPHPKEEPTIITASIREDASKVTLEEIEYFAEVTPPSGSKTAFNLNDRGLEGDKVAGDGFYSIRIPPLTEQGSYQVTLKLSWPQYNSVISTESTFRVEPFPSIDIEILPTQGLEIGKPVRIATISVNVDGEPFPVTLEQISASASLFDGSTVPVEILARQVFGEGRAWSYYATITPQKSGQHNLNLSLRVNYLGRDHISFAKSLLFEVPEPAAVATEEPPFPIPVWAFVLIALGGLVVALAAVWAIGTRPYGYLYDDQGQEVVAFERLSRKPVMKILFKSSVRGSETGVRGLEDVSFGFSRKGVHLRYIRHTHTIRVNNQPVTDRAVLSDRSWIGTQGKLLMFLSHQATEPPTFTHGNPGPTTQTS